ncbi:MAG: hypothetical protein AB1349_07995 [Elusimicrobiota bacterium]
MKKITNKAQSMTEYILVIFLIAILAYLAVETFGKRIRYGFISAGNKVSGICDEHPGIQH